MDNTVQDIDDSNTNIKQEDNIESIINIPEEHISQNVENENERKRKASEMDESDNENHYSLSTASLAKRRITVDIGNAIYLKPFDFGWKREVVYRKNKSSRKNAEIYYITPTGKKLRSKYQIEQNLNKEELTIDNFTLSQIPIGLSSEMETVREAKGKSDSKKVVTRTAIEVISFTPLKLIKKPKEIKETKEEPEETKSESSEEMDTSTMLMCSSCDKYFDVSCMKLSSDAVLEDFMMDQTIYEDFQCDKCKSEDDEAPSRTIINDNSLINLVDYSSSSSSDD